MAYFKRYISITDNGYIKVLIKANELGLKS